MTPHISAKKEDIAKVVLMPGDPLRAKYVAEHYLKDAKLINQVRGMLGYTGAYKGVRVSVMAHGMGIPSIGIYTHELFHFYDVDTIIRIGSAGGFTKEADVGAVIVVQNAYSNSHFADDIGMKTSDKYFTATKETLNLCVATAKEHNIETIVGNVLSEDAFYHATPWEMRAKEFPNLIGVEMEAFALYVNALRNHKHALCILTVSDSFVSGKSMTPIERQTSLNDMITLGLETAIKIGQ